MTSTPEQASLDERWTQYEQLDRIRDHWYWRPGWRVGRSFYTWHITFADAHALHDLVRRLQPELDLPCLDLVPMEGLHLTMQGLGFTDEVSPDDTDAIADAVAARCRSISCIELTLGPVDPDAEGIGLLVTPWQPVIALRSAVRRAISTIWPMVPESEDFRPHVTLAYSNSNAEAAPVRRRLASLRSAPPVSVRIDSIQLIRLNRDDKVYRWDVHRTVQLGT